MLDFVLRTAAAAIGLIAWSAAAAERPCYDAKVRARPVDQIPSVIGDCGSDCIVMSWPWFVALDVRRVIDGVSPGRGVWTLAVQHTYILSRESIYWLRRNAAGSYNIVSAEDGAALTRCPAGEVPARSYIGVADGRDLDALRSDAIRTYGHHRN